MRNVLANPYAREDDGSLAYMKLALGSTMLSVQRFLANVFGEVPGVPP